MQVFFLFFYVSPWYQHFYGDKELLKDDSRSIEEIANAVDWDFSFAEILQYYLLFSTC